MGLYGTIGTFTHTKLLSDPQGADVISVPCEPGHGDISRGAILYRKASGMYAPAALSDIAADKALVVLDEGVKTSADLETAEVARAYRAGRFIASAVSASDDAITAAKKLLLRQQGIILEGEVGTGTFTNTRVKITYKANTGTGSDVVVYADAGSTYTIAANAFTAPATKSFSKWNTAADGAGTDYAAAASYTANADLTLYAVWA